MISNRSIKDLVDFLTEKFKKLPDTINNKEFITKFDQLLNTNINRGDIKLMKTFVEFCYNEMQSMKLKYENNKRFYDDYTLNLANECKLLRLKVNQLNLKIQQLENEKTSDKSRIASLESNVVTLKSNIVKLKSNIVGLESNIMGLESNIRGLKSENSNLQNTTNQLKNQNTQLQNKVQELTNITTELTKANKKFEATIQELKKEKEKDKKSLKEELELSMHKMLNLNQALLKSEEEKTDIKERDNYTPLSTLF